METPQISQLSFRICCNNVNILIPKGRQVKAHALCVLHSSPQFPSRQLHRHIHLVASHVSDWKFLEVTINIFWCLLLPPFAKPAKCYLSLLRICNEAYKISDQYLPLT
jgi:hypothetical protein